MPAEYIKNALVTIVLFLMSEIHIITKVASLGIVFSKPVFVTLTCINIQSALNNLVIMWSIILVLLIGYSEYHYFRGVMYFIILSVSTYPFNTLVYDNITNACKYFFVTPPETVMSSAFKYLDPSAIAKFRADYLPF